MGSGRRRTKRKQGHSIATGSAQVSFGKSAVNFRHTRNMAMLPRKRGCFRKAGAEQQTSEEQQQKLEMKAIK